MREAVKRSDLFVELSRRISTVRPRVLCELTCLFPDLIVCRFGTGHINEMRAVFLEQDPMDLFLTTLRHVLSTQAGGWTQTFVDMDPADAESSGLRQDALPAMVAAAF